MTGTPLNDFNDFVEATTSTYVTSPRGIINEAVKNTYWFGRLIQGQNSKKKMLQGGANIRANLIFQDNGTFETYLPGAAHTWVNPQRLKKLQIEWRYTMAHMSWVEQEILNNDAVTFGTDSARFMQFVELRNEKEALMWTSKWNGLENLLWAVPSNSTMEAADGTEPYSVPAFVNEQTNGLYSGFTTVEGLDPTDASLNSKWAPQRQQYSDDLFTEADNILVNFDNMWHDVEFEQPPTMKQYWEDPRYNKMMIVTSKRGRAIIMNLLRQGQDHFVAGPQDPAYPDPQYHGIPIQRASTLEAATIFGATGGDTEFSGTDKGPRYFFLNAEYLYPIFHAQRYFYKHEVTKHHNVPDTWVAPVATWYNIICTSRQRQGIVYPLGTVFGS